MTVAERKLFRDRLHLELTDKQLEDELPPYYQPGPDSPEYTYLMERRRALVGFLPERVDRSRKTVVNRARSAESARSRTSGSEPIGIRFHQCASRK